jgi:hypothetical protein
VARDFDGVDDVIDFGSPAALDGIALLSVSIIARFDALSFGEGLVSKYGADGWYFSVGSAYDLERPFFTRQTIVGAGDWDANVDLVTGTTYQLGVSHDAGSVANDPTLVVDGVVQAITERLTPTGSFPSDAAESLLLGFAGIGLNRMDGPLAEAAMWDILLTAAEWDILGKRYSPLLVRPQNLVFYAPLFGNYSPEIDVVGGNLGTITGALKAVHPRVYYPRKAA